MQWLGEKVQRLAVVMVLLGSVGMMVSMFICVADVTGTNFFGWPVDGTLEITESTMVLIVFGALAYTQEQRGHIRVELLHGFMSPRVKSFMDVVTHPLAFVFFALLGWQSFSEPPFELPRRPGSIRFRLSRTPASHHRHALLVVQLALDVISDAGHERQGPPRRRTHRPTRRKSVDEHALTSPEVAGCHAVGAADRSLALGAHIGVARPRILGIFLTVGRRRLRAVAAIPFSTTTFTLAVIPLFILMGPSPPRPASSRAVPGTAYLWLGTRAGHDVPSTGRVRAASGSTIVNAAVPPRWPCRR